MWRPIHLARRQQMPFQRRFPDIVVSTGYSIGIIGGRYSFAPVGHLLPTPRPPPPVVQDTCRRGRGPGARVDERGANDAGAVEETGEADREDAAPGRRPSIRRDGGELKLQQTAVPYRQCKLDGCEIVRATGKSGLSIDYCVYKKNGDRRLHSEQCLGGRGEGPKLDRGGIICCTILY